MNKRAIATQQVLHRPGEGHLIDMVVLASDSETTTVRLEASGLPVPDRKFSCDAMQVTSTNVGARLLLAQRLPVGEGLLSMLVVTMAPEAVEQFLRSIDEAFVQQARGYVEAHKGSEEEVVFTTNAAQSVVVNCSYVLAGYTGLAACMDLYNQSPFSVQSMFAAKKVAMDPVVRVNFSTGLLVALVDGLRREVQNRSWNFAVPPSR